jgi:hypothetical protein
MTRSIAGADPRLGERSAVDIQRFQGGIGLRDLDFLELMRRPAGRRNFGSDDIDRWALSRT